MLCSSCVNMKQLRILRIKRDKLRKLKTDLQFLPIVYEVTQKTMYAINGAVWVSDYLRSRYRDTVFLYSNDTSSQRFENIISIYLTFSWKLQCLLHDTATNSLSVSFSVTVSKNLLRTVRQTSTRIKSTSKSIPQQT